MSGLSPGVPRRFQELTFYRGYGATAAGPPRCTSCRYGTEHPRQMGTRCPWPHPAFAAAVEFSDHLGKIGMCRNESLNTALEKSHCTGSDTFITAYEHLDFHPSYNPSGPSHCRDQPL
ncbi:UPF0691 protein C9orf116 homolog isoform X3 [Parus major]|uniref:UPF0691 protein C9orf116 homolog isoform X3 n=1 Tax=Parus major TaxID=9157 RepID=UPI0007712F8C|nr:UPF0691 protein C9orf116 homolog isoform X3 [Parus major]